MSTTTKKKALAATSATGISAIGLLMCPALGQALPMIPLAPPCTQYGFPGDVTIREVGTGWNVNFSATGPAFNGVAQASGPGGASKAGDIKGFITDQGHVEINVRYNAVDFDGNKVEGYPQNYIGEVGDDAKAHGVTQNGIAKESNIPWDTVFPLSCITIPPQAPAVPQVPPPEQAPPPGQPNDRDSDGLLDADEADVYGTNPDVADSDGDGPDDGQEVFDGTDPRDPNDP